MKHLLDASLQRESNELLIITLKAAMMYGLILEIVYITSKKIIASGVDQELSFVKIINKFLLGMVVNLSKSIAAD